MKANGLMRGDHILYNGNTHCVVTALERGKIAVMSVNADGKFAYSSLFDEGLFEPIEITDEILAKNFNFDPNNSEGAFEHYYWLNDFLEMEISQYTDGLWEVVVDEVEMSGLPTWKMYVCNVHELQHALRLAGVEKKIEL